MKFHKNQKTARYGWSLYVRRQGETKFEPVPYTFLTRYEADQYRQKNYPTATAARIMGNRVNIVPLPNVREGSAEK